MDIMAFYEARLLIIYWFIDYFIGGFTNFMFI